MHYKPYLERFANFAALALETSRARLKHLHMTPGTSARVAVRCTSSKHSPHKPGNYYKALVDYTQGSQPQRTNSDRT
eukprot:m.65723 g.65723  ORF g.65723 m.65723 type:complete len:77 (+) comp12071_c0_seq2:1212-1442(+)